MFVSRRRWTAMGSTFEVFLVGDDLGLLDAVAEAVRDDVVQLEQLLSRFDTTSEISRVNRVAVTRPCRVSHPVGNFLAVCGQFARRTNQAFDIVAGSRWPRSPSYTLDPFESTVRFHTSQVRFDLGGIGKGFALDRSADIVRQNGVEAALIHAGTSSVVAVGRPPDGAPWTIALRNPADDRAPPVGRVSLHDRSLSYSAARRTGQIRSDIIDPNTGRPIEGTAACLAVTASATEAEVLSTALLVMGRDGAARYLDRDGWGGASVAWIDAGRLEWLTEAP